MKPIKFIALLTLFSFVNLVSFSQTGCPTIRVVASSDMIKEGTSATFTASVTGDGNFTYNWSVSAGAIESGQGTQSITVNTEGLASQTVTATIELGGLNPSCVRSASYTISISSNPKAILFAIGDFKNISELTDRVNVTTEALKISKNDPFTGSSLVIYLYQGTNRKDAYLAEKKAAIIKAFDKSQVLPFMYKIIILPRKNKKVDFEIWDVPFGAAEPPTLK